MKKFKGTKKILALLLSLSLITGMMPATAWNAFAAEEKASVDADLTAALAEAKVYTDALTINNNSNDPETVVKNFETHFTWDNEKREGTNGKGDKGYLYDWSYYNGVVFEGIEYLYENTDDNTAKEKYKEYVIEYMSSLIASNGTWAKCTNNTSKECAGYNSTHGADCYKTASLLLDAYEMTNDSRYLTMAKTLYADLDTAAKSYSLSNAGNNFRHTWKSDPSPDLWLDGLYMILPFRAEYAKYKGDTAELNLIVSRMQWVSDNMYNEDDGLFYHAADSASSNSGTYWLRSMGWYAAAMVDIMDSMEGNNLEAMKKQLKKMVDGMADCQNSSNGMWLNNMKASQSSKNPYETSGTALVCYAVMKAVNNGWLDASYADMAIKAFKGICNEKLSGTTLKDICYIGVPGSSNSTFKNNEGKGVGPFIMFYAEMLEYVNNQQKEEPPVDSEEPETPAESGTHEVTIDNKTIKVDHVTALNGDFATEADKVVIEAKGYTDFVAYDLTATFPEGGTTPKVHIPIPAEWNATADKLVGISVEDGVVVEIPGELSADGIYSFEVDHFSAKGVALVAETAAPVTSVVYSVSNTALTDIDGNGYYLIRNGRNGLYLSDTRNSSDMLELQGDNTDPAELGDYTNYIWYITQANNNNSYHIRYQDAAGQYLKFGAGSSELTNTPTETTVNNRLITQGIQNLNNYSGAAQAGGWTGNDEGSKWNFYKVTATPVTLSVDQSTINIKPNQSADLKATVTINNVEASEGYTINWTSENDNVATVEDGIVTGHAEGTTSITATLTKVNGNELVSPPIVLKIPVTVANKQISSVRLIGNNPIITQQNVVPDFSDVKLVVTYDNNSTTEFTVADGLRITGYDVSKIGSYYALISYQGTTYGTMKITVTGTNADGTAKSPYDGLEQTTVYPEYPEQGAVRIDKKATSAAGEFERTGVTHVELDVAGISSQKAVDVVLVVDVSNSMAWSVDNAHKDGDDNKVPTEGTGQISKIRQTMNSCKEFAEIILAENKDGTVNDNTITFVTFGGFDDQHENTDTEYFDSTKTWMLGEQDINTINNMFDSVSIVRDTSYPGGYKISIDGETGGNFGNTVYDYGFAETMDAINRLQGSSYDTNKRETHVVFMTDGAPSNYNGGYYKGGRAENLKVESNDQFDNIGKDNKDTWFNYINSVEHKYAKQVYNKVNGKFSTVGFDLEHGGFNKWQWGEAELSSFLTKIIRDTDGNGVNPVVAATDEAELAQFYREAAAGIKAAGSQGRVTDIVDSAFTLQLASQTGMTTNNPQTLNTPPKITVSKYELWTAKDTDDLSLIGKRKLDSNGNPIKEVLETVTFNAAGTEAYSNRVEHGSKNILSEVNGVTTIEAQTFTYKKDVNDVESFEWFIETISDKEAVLEFDVYLKGALEGEADKGTYYTNEQATLEYIDCNGKYVNRLFPVPVVNWGGATTTVRYYLVNEDGQPVNRAGQVVPDSARIYVGDPVTVPLNLNADLTISSSTIAAAANVPKGYFLYDNQASYCVQTTSSTEGIIGGIVLSEPSPDAFKITGNGNSIKTQNGAQTTVVIDYDPEYYVYSTIGFGVRWDLTEEKISPLENDKIVIDYGKAIRTDVLANDTEEIARIGAEKDTTYNAQLVGLTEYKANTDLGIIQISEGRTNLSGKMGNFSIVEGKVEYKPTKMLSEIDKVFCVVKLTNTENATDFFYMYEQLDVIPATTMYYETDFADKVFTNVTKTAISNDEEGWDEYTDKMITDVPEDFKSDVDKPQDDGTIGVDRTYGYDSTYDNDQYLSNESSLFVEGQGIKLNEDATKYTYSQFEFTGTGFDLISRTGAAQGAIRVDIYTDEARTVGNRVKSVTVLNKSESNLELYQIPVVSVNDLDYGTYYVTVGVNAAYENEKYPQLNRGGEFYFDAIRIFDPAQGNEEAEAAYKADNEYNMSLIEVRSQVIPPRDYGETAGTFEVVGVTFVDSTYDKDEEGNSTNPTHKPGDVGAAEYSSIGPNNEVYLATDQGIVFEINCTGGIPGSVDIGAKTITGGTAQMEAYISGNPEDPGDAVINVKIASSTAQFQNLVGGNAKSFNEGGTAYVFVRNTGKDVLSITDLKIAYSGGEETGAVSLLSSARTLAFAKACVASVAVPEESDTPVVPDAPVTPEKPDTPVVPDTPVTPEEPDTPVVPDAPVTPEEPDTPVVPDAPVTPEEPDTPPAVDEPETPVAAAAKIISVKTDKKTYTQGDKVKVTVTTNKAATKVKVGTKVLKNSKAANGNKTWTTTVNAAKIGKLSINATAYNSKGTATKKVRKVVTVKQFAPKTFNVALSKSKVKKGVKYTVTVKVGTTVKYVKVNGKKITKFTTKKGVRTFKATYKAGKVGKQKIKVIAYNKAGYASKAKTKTLTVTKK